MPPTPIAVFLFSIGVAYALLSAFRSNFMRGSNSSKKQGDVLALVILTLVVWSLIPVGK